jgi:hypothetical protein
MGTWGRCDASPGTGAAHILVIRRSTWLVLGTKRVRRRSIFGDDYVGSPNHRRIMARRQLMRLLSTFLYGLGGVLVGFAFLVITRRR